MLRGIPGGRLWLLSFAPRPSLRALLVSCKRLHPISTRRAAIQWRRSGQLDALVPSGARLSEKLSVIGAHRKGELTGERTTRIGPGRAFGRLWEETGISACLKRLLGDLPGEASA